MKANVSAGLLKGLVGVRTGEMLSVTETTARSHLSPKLKKQNTTLRKINKHSHTLTKAAKGNVYRSFQ